ncbi:MAG TPA: hypothetical protein VMG12_07940 [Polyangiaceae bacterium]|nr:hypothetical protein [Polyangiaceae bacterium]
MRFAWATGVGLLGVLLLGWLTGLRAVMHALLITLGATALLPFVLVLGIVGVLGVVSLASSILVDEATLRTVAETSGSRYVHAYEAQLARQRERPLGWGLAVGSALGVVGVWLVLAALVIPLETHTLSVLRLAQARLASMPPAAAASSAADGVLRPSAWSVAAAAASSDQPVLDAFGHPIAHEAGAAGGFTLRSLGLDGVGSGDDLCASGRVGSNADAAGEALGFVEALRGDRLDWSAKLRALAEARCVSSR